MTRRERRSRPSGLTGAAHKTLAGVTTSLPTLTAVYAVWGEVR